MGCTQLGCCAHGHLQGFGASGVALSTASCATRCMTCSCKVMLTGLLCVGQPAVQHYAWQVDIGSTLQVAACMDLWSRIHLQEGFAGNRHLQFKSSFWVTTGVPENQCMITYNTVHAHQARTFVLMLSPLHSSYSSCRLRATSSQQHLQSCCDVDAADNLKHNVCCQSRSACLRHTPCSFSVCL